MKGNLKVAYIEMKNEHIKITKASASTRIKRASSFIEGVGNEKIVNK